MCLILLAYRQHDRYPLILAANRDEYYRRPSTPLGFWEDAPQLLAGRDRLAGGTWLGVTRDGRFAALTNVREPGRQIADAPSRGALVADFLRGTETAQDYLRALQPRAGAFNGFNLLLGDIEGLYGFSNRGDTRILPLPPGLYGLGNAPLDQTGSRPLWPKEQRGLQSLARRLERTPTVEQLLDLLQDRWQPPDEDLPNTGIDPERERALAPMFIATPDYGTCSSAALLIGTDGILEFGERLHPSGDERHFRVSPTAGVSSLTRCHRTRTAWN